MNPITLSSSSIENSEVYNLRDENLGNIKDLMIDLNSGRIAYAVLSFGGFLGLGDKLFAVPWDAIQIDADDEKFLLDVTKERLEEAPGFDKDNWPMSADTAFLDAVYTYYQVKPYWDSRPTY